jgi:hypothetical protein
MGTSTTEVEKVIPLALIVKAAADLAKTCERSQLSPTDVVNRAISLYEFLDEERAWGTEVLLRRCDGSTFSLQLMCPAPAVTPDLPPHTGSSSGSAFRR